MTITEAFEIHAGSSDAPIFVTCEHATQRMPTGWSWPEEDRRLIDTHWAYDLGALDLAHDLAESLGTTCLSTRFSRLLCDPNRPEGSPTLFRELAEGKPVALNTRLLDEAERARRLALLHGAYHDAAGAAIEASRAPTIVSMHSFTRHYEGEWRELEVGVLYDRDEALAEAVASELGKHGLHVGLNEPYSGKGGLMYAVERHATRFGRRCLELEVRQDLATYRGFRRELGPLLREIFRAR